MSRSERVAVHFGAGNIGRGFIGALLQDAGYFVVFADVNQNLIDSMLSAGGYVVTELDGAQRAQSYSNFTALNSITQQDELLDGAPDLIKQALAKTKNVALIDKRRIAS